MMWSGFSLRAFDVEISGVVWALLGVISAVVVVRKRGPLLICPSPLPPHASPPGAAGFLNLSQSGNSSANQAPSSQPVGGARTRPTTTRVNVIASSSRRRCRAIGRRASPGTPGTARGGWPAILCRQRPIHRRRAGGSSNGARYPRSFRPTGCIGPRNGICAKSLSCLLVAEPLRSDLFLSAKYLRFAANEAVRSARPARGTPSPTLSCPIRSDRDGRKLR